MNETLMLDTAVSLEYHAHTLSAALPCIAVSALCVPADVLCGIHLEHLLVLWPHAQVGHDDRLADLLQRTVRLEQVCGEGADGRQEQSQGEEVGQCCSAGSAWNRPTVQVVG